MLDDQIKPLLETLGLALKKARKMQFPTDNQGAFARRIGVSRATYQKMEKGNGSVHFNHYVKASILLGTEDKLRDFFTIPKEQPNLLDKFGL
ncbi:helix-turn-helix domain-containing protein [Neptuniibacter sp. QD37_11]|uniref:helix-turn-helix domain-containing protein n=1 Tax=Neptuniibacter sp. QD37_11 TaxID=3398209 RepID=UPI0039F58B20